MEDMAREGLSLPEGLRKAMVPILVPGWTRTAETSPSVQYNGNHASGSPITVGFKDDELPKHVDER